MIDPRQLQALAEVAAQASFERAARRLHLTQSAISQRIRALEAQVGQPLLVRQRPVRPTAAGARLLRYYRQVERLTQHVLGDLALGETGVGSVALGVNADSLATWLPDALDDLLAGQRIRVELHVDDQDVTHHLLREGRVIGCISAHAEAVQSCDRVPLGIMDYVAVAAPDYVRRVFPEGVTPAALQTTLALDFNGKDALQSTFAARRGLDPDRLQRHQVPSSEGFLELIRRGHGWGMAPAIQVAGDLQAGRLVTIAPDDVLSVPLYWHVWNITTPVIRELTEALRRAAATALHPLGGG